MDRDFVPAWLAALVGFFGLLAFGAFFTFLHFYTATEAAYEMRAVAEAKVEELRRQKGVLEETIPQLDTQIRIRDEKIETLQEDDQDKISTTLSVLAPAHDQELAQTKDLLEKKTARLERLLKSANDARNELKTAELQRQEAEVTGEDERERLRDKIKQLSLAIEVEKRDQLKELLALEKVLKQRNDRIQELLDRRTNRVEELISDGQLLEARANQGFVIINRGLYDDIRLAQRFVVYNRRGGTNRIKGEVEVIEVEPHMSIARVVNEVDPNDPLIPGDHIHNNIYNPDETKIYVLAGDFERYSQAELARFIRDAGGQVDPEITTKTHYLVAGAENSAEALAEASANGVTVLSENQLLEAIRRTERYKIRRGMTFALAGSFSLVEQGKIEEFIRRSGGIITSEIGDGLHVLIAGEGADEETAAASLVGAEIINENQLLYLMGPQAVDSVLDDENQ